MMVIALGSEAEAKIATDATHVVIGIPPIQTMLFVALVGTTIVAAAVPGLDRDRPSTTDTIGRVERSDVMMMNVLGTEAPVVTATMAASEHQVLRA